MTTFWLIIQLQFFLPLDPNFGPMMYQYSEHFPTRKACEDRMKSEFPDQSTVLLRDNDGLFAQQSGSGGQSQTFYRCIELMR